MSKIKIGSVYSKDSIRYKVLKKIKSDKYNVKVWGPGINTHEKEMSKSLILSLDLLTDQQHYGGVKVPDNMPPTNFNKKRKMKSINEWLSEQEVNESVKNYIKNVLSKYLDKERIKFSFDRKIGYDQYLLDNNQSIIFDGVGIKVKKDKKEIAYINNPKANYKQVIKHLDEKIDEARHIDIAYMTKRLQQFKIDKNMDNLLDGIVIDMNIEKNRKGKDRISNIKYHLTIIRDNILNAKRHELKSIASEIYNLF